MIYEALELLTEYKDVYEFESCAENTRYKLGCISEKDLKILDVNIDTISGDWQRKYCLCLGNKKELLSNKKRCRHKCLYCYWRDYSK